MRFARIFWPLVATAVLAACSGNLGGGQSTLPGTPQSGTNVQQVAPPPATATPSSASAVATIGDDAAPQALPNILGWGGSIVFPKPSPAASASPNPKGSSSTSGAAAPAPVSIGITASVVEPADTPQFDPNAKHRGKRDAGGLNPLLFVSLMSTSDVTLSAYPKIAFDVPRDIAAKHRDDTFALALYDPEQKEKAFRLAVAERDLSAPLPGTLPSPVTSAAPTPIPTPIPNGPIGLTPPPMNTPPPGAGLPPERIAFGATATALTLKSDRPVVFALYAVPAQPSPSPSPSAAKPKRSAAPGPTPSAAASPTPIGSPTAPPTAAATAPPSASTSAPAPVPAVTNGPQ